MDLTTNIKNTNVSLFTLCAVDPESAIIGYQKASTFKSKEPSVAQKRKTQERQPEKKSSGGFCPCCPEKDEDVKSDRESELTKPIN